MFVYEWQVISRVLITQYKKSILIVYKSFGVIQNVIQYILVIVTI